MATKGILREAIKKLERNNKLILLRLSKTTDIKKKEELLNTMTRNNSMMLDYEYRLKNE